MYKRFFILLFYACSIFATDFTYESKVVESKLFASDTQVLCKLTGSDFVIGQAYYTQLPCAHYVIHSFYIHPSLRNQGYGTQLLAYVCNELKQKHAKKVYIQPGPFEFCPDGKLMQLEVQERTVRLAQLIRLYQKVGFKNVNTCASYCARLFYKIMGIDQDAQHLMVLHL